jgi:hypothetical protein
MKLLYSSRCPASPPPLPHELLGLPSYTQGVDPSNVDAVEKLILDKLSELAQSGFSAGAVEAAINTIEFSLRENNTGSFPRGLSLMLRAMGAWIYDRDPYTPIQVPVGGVWGVWRCSESLRAGHCKPPEPA